jgi:recombination protein RecR
MLDGPLDTMIKQLASLPGLGTRSARRIALHLLTRKDALMIPLSKSLRDAANAIKTCAICQTLDTADPCRICRDPARDRGTICIVATVADVWAVERTGSFKGVYHVLGGVLSALDGVGPDQLTLAELVSRVQEGAARELIIALPATVDGQSTAHVIADRLHGLPVTITRLAHGMPIGGELDYLDDGTIATALKSRARV